MSSGYSKRTRSQNEDNTISRDSESLKDSDISWFGDYSTCSEQLKHYHAFSWRETHIEVHSFVWILNKDGPEKIGYIEDMYEDPQGTKMVRARLFILAKDIQHRISGLSPNSKEIFLTPSLHEVRADLIDGVAAVLTLEHFEKCREFLPRTLASKPHFSAREYKDDGTLCPFVPSEFEGYSEQPIFISLEHYKCVPRKVVLALECPGAPSSLVKKRQTTRSKKLL